MSAFDDLKRLIEGEGLKAQMRDVLPRVDAEIAEQKTRLEDVECQLAESKAENARHKSESDNLSETEIQILCLLAGERLTLSAVMEKLQLTSPTAAHYLRELRLRNFVTVSERPWEGIY